MNGKLVGINMGNYDSAFAEIAGSHFNGQPLAIGELHQSKDLSIINCQIEIR
jgi:hypothetical protein